MRSIPGHIKTSILKGSKLGASLWAVFALTQIIRFILHGNEIDLFDIGVMLPVFIFVFSCGFIIMRRSDQRGQDQRGQSN